MTGRLLRWLVAGVFPVLAGAALNAGGWVVITTQDLPDHVVVGKPIVLTYAVRQHGRTLLGDLKGGLEAKSGKRVVTAVSTPAPEVGQYTVSFVLPTPGTWTIAIDSGFFGNYSQSRFTLQAVDAGAPAPLVTEMERGKRLFAAKGCAMCHTTAGFEGPSVDVGPSLTAKRFQPGYLKSFLTNPRGNDNGREFPMPDLGLRVSEIDSLVAYLNGKKS